MRRAVVLRVPCADKTVDRQPSFSYRWAVKLPTTGNRGQLDKRKITSEIAFPVYFADVGKINVTFFFFFFFFFLARSRAIKGISHTKNKIFGSSSRCSIWCDSHYPYRAAAVPCGRHGAGSLQGNMQDSCPPTLRYRCDEQKKKDVQVLNSSTSSHFSTW